MITKKKPLRRLQPGTPTGKRPTGISDDLLKKLKNIIMRKKMTPDLKRKIGEIMSPGRVKAITGKNPGEGKKPRVRVNGKLVDFGKRDGIARKPSGRMSKDDIAKATGMGARKGLSRAGMAGMSKTVFNEAKKLKPSGRLSVADMKRAREMLKKRKGK